MNTKTFNVLVTDQLFIDKNHEKILSDAGIKVSRLNETYATEDQLIAALQGQHGYIIGGCERVTERVLKNLTDLKVIAFTGSDALAFVPGYKVAKEKNIVITNCPASVTDSVAEFTLAAILGTVRKLSTLALSKKSITTESVLDLKVGIVGLGRIANRLVFMLNGIGVKEIMYSNRTRYPEVENSTGIRYKNFDELLGGSDVVVLLASSARGKHYFGKNEFAKMKNGAILINTSFEDALDLNAAYDACSSGAVRIFQDGTIDDARFEKLDADKWQNTPGTAFNTSRACRLAGDAATQSVINVLKNSYDINIVRL